MTTEAPHPGALPFSLREKIDMFLGDLELVSTVELAAQIDNPLLGNLFALILERRRAARLTRDEDPSPHMKSVRH